MASYINGTLIKNEKVTTWNGSLIALLAPLLIAGCLTTTMDPAGNISSDSKTIPEVVAKIENGVTTKQDLIRMYGEPSSQSSHAGRELLFFGEKVPFWETGATSFVTGRQKVRMLQVTILNGVVVDHSTQETWTKRK